MKKYRTPLVLLCLMVLLAGLFYSLYTAPAQPAAPPLRISLVLYERGDPWAALQMGVRQACGDLGLELTTTTPADGDDPQRQQALVERELASGASGILLAANDSDALRNWALEAAAATPLVLLQSGIGEALPLVAPDNAAMGRSLAQAVAGRETRVLALAVNLRRDSVRQRYEAFAQAAAEAGVQVDFFSGEIENLAAQFALYPVGGIPPLVAFDTETLDAAIDTALALPQPPDLYGFGGSDKSVYHLDRGLVRQMCCEDEYTMGYLAVLQLANKMGLPTPDVPDAVSYALASRDNMYEEELARLLFPVIQ